MGNIVVKAGNIEQHLRVRLSAFDSYVIVPVPFYSAHILLSQGFPTRDSRYDSMAFDVFKRAS